MSKTKALDIGDKAPDFSALATPDDQTVQLAKLKGSPVVLFFYPRDNTPGCTIENKDFSTLKSKFDRLGVKLYGLSRDTLKAHHSFCTKQDLTVSLLADPEETICNLYGVMVDKNMYGKKVRGIERTTFLLDAKGKIIHIWRKVKVPDHAAEVLQTAKDLLK